MKTHHLRTATVFFVITVLSIFTFSIVHALSFNDLTNYQKQKYWGYMGECQSLLLAKNYKEYRTCALNAFQKAADAKESQAWCKDSDTGADFFTKGTVKSDLFPNGKEDYSYTFQNGKTYVIEGMCDGNNKYYYIQKNCAEMNTDTGKSYVAKDGICIEKKDESLISCNSLGGEWNILIDGEYTYEYDPIYGADREVLEKVTKEDVVGLIKAMDSNSYKKYCYTQEALDPKNEKLNAVRLCNASGKLLKDSDILDEDNYAICDMNEALPAGPTKWNDYQFLYDHIGLSSNTSVDNKQQNKWIGDPAIYKDRMTMKYGDIFKTSTSFFMNGFDMFGEKIKQKFRITIQAQK